VGRLKIFAPLAKGGLCLLVDEVGVVFPGVEANFALFVCHFVHIHNEKRVHYLEELGLLAEFGAGLGEAEVEEDGHVETLARLRLRLENPGHQVANDEAVEFIGAHLGVDERARHVHDVLLSQLLRVHERNQHLSNHTPELVVRLAPATQVGDKAAKLEGVHRDQVAGPYLRLQGPLEHLSYAAPQLSLVILILVHGGDGDGELGGDRNGVWLRLEVAGVPTLHHDGLDLSHEFGAHIVSEALVATKITDVCQILQLDVLGVGCRALCNEHLNLAAVLREVTCALAEHEFGEAED